MQGDGTGFGIDHDDEPSKETGTKDAIPPAGALAIGRQRRHASGRVREAPKIEHRAFEHLRFFLAGYADDGDMAAATQTELVYDVRVEHGQPVAGIDHKGDLLAAIEPSTDHHVPTLLFKGNYNRIGGRSRKKGPGACEGDSHCPLQHPVQHADEYNRVRILSKCGKGMSNQQLNRFISISAVKSEFRPFSRSFTQRLVARANGPLPVLLAAVAIFGSGCISYPLDKPVRAAAPLPSSFEAPPKQRTAPTLAEEKEREKHRSYDVKTINLKVNENRTMGAEYFLPKQRKNHPKMPAIVILPIMGGKTYPVEEIFASTFARHGYACIIPHRPNIKDEIKNLEDIDPLLQHSSYDVSRAIDWLETQPNIDASRIGLFGISLGAIRGTIVMAMDKRIRAGVLGLGGGDLPYILTHSNEKRLMAARDKILARNNIDVKEAEARLRESITYDPLALAPSVDPERVLMVIAAADKVIPPSKSWELRRKLGNPEAIELWSGHYTSVIHIPYLRQACARFFKKKFAEPASATAMPLAAHSGR